MRTCTLTGVVTRKEYVCCKQGYALISTVSHKRRWRGCTRTGCKAKLVILKVKYKNKYIVVGFNEVHSHDMTTVDKVHLLRSHHNLTEPTKAYSADMSKVNIPVHKQLNLLEVQVRGLENVGFVKRYVYNYIRDVRGEVIGNDAELLKERFMAMQEKNESFYFKMEVDLEGRMGNVFWSDARSRRAYEFFGDVVVFDTTFNTNRYGMFFVPLLGVNNHRQTVLFGCAFLTSETTDSFVWLLEEFKKAMLGEPPKMIITDQDAAMSKAIAVTLPTTFHRYCIWHILNKITEKPGIGECFLEMNKCIWGMDKKEEFDAK
ncbi:protein FAR1-RELATED SEQUENCE 5-like [Prunus persica]|uniref:protein FAR1-RELATED SEQUENCE 5-like n=1 Tax=Prunus persica TaxID=3760 RepID=UPI0009AB4FDB|nr:protein FAR1-RELATED SEQUENCE 5-like [Prunus persica]